MALSLEKNQVERIGEDTFLGLHNLKKLYLSDNKITELGPGVFDDLHNVERIELHENPIQSFVTRYVCTIK